MGHGSRRAAGTAPTTGPSAGPRSTPSSDAANRWIFPELHEEPWAGVQWIAVPHGPAETHAVDVSAVVDKAIASLAAHEQYILGLGIDDPVGVRHRARRAPDERRRRPLRRPRRRRLRADPRDRRRRERPRASAGGCRRAARSRPRSGYCRAVAVGERIFVSGTAPQWPDGTVAADAGDQARRCFEIIGAALAELGSGLEDIVRVRVYLVDAADFAAVAAVHGELFADIRPTNTTVVVAALLDPAVEGRDRGRGRQSVSGAAGWARSSTTSAPGTVSSIDGGPTTLAARLPPPTTMRVACHHPGIDPQRQVGRQGERRHAADGHPGELGRDVGGANDAFLAPRRLRTTRLTSRRVDASTTQAAYVGRRRRPDGLPMTTMALAESSRS